MKKYEDYSNSVLFKVGQRVHIELPEIPKEERDITTGIIIKIDTMYPAKPKLRKIRCTVRIDGKGNYIKEKFRLFGGIKHDFTCDQNRLIAIV